MVLLLNPYVIEGR